jgi:hypothetical protein
MPVTIFTNQAIYFIHALSKIQTRDPSSQAAADLRLRLRGHRDRPYTLLVHL